jgi:hypothetical protein
LGILTDEKLADLWVGLVQVIEILVVSEVDVTSVSLGGVSKRYVLSHSFNKRLESAFCVVAPIPVPMFVSAVLPRAGKVSSDV